MAAYIIPQVQVFQDFRRAPQSVVNPRNAHISGGHAFLVRFTDEDERELGLLGLYDRLLDTDYAWPNQPAGSRIDPGYTRIFVKDGLLKYFEDFIGSGSVIAKVGPNRIRSATINFADFDVYPRHSSLKSRDVQPGDVAKVRAIVGGNPVTLWTYVKAVRSDQLPSSVGSASGDPSNAATQGASSSVTKLGGPDNCVVASANISAYNGLPDGFINETYDIIVTESSVGGNFTTARLRVISGSGLDDQDSVVPAAAGNPTNIGARGLQVTFDVNVNTACSLAAASEGVSHIDLIAGQRWRVTVQQAFTAPTATSGGTYDYNVDTTYIVEIERGGLFSATVKPRIKVTTTTGIDLSGPTIVPAAATPVAVGSYGVTIQFSGAGLRKGDKYYIPVTGIKDGPRRILELGHNLPDGVLDNQEVDLTLFIRKPTMEIPENRIGFAPLKNWAQSQTQITLYAGVIGYDSSWHDGGVPQPLPLYSEASLNYGLVYVHYRAWRSELCNNVFTVATVDDLDDVISGPLHQDNPLKWGVFKALSNSNGVPVRCTSVCNPDDLDSWQRVLELLGGRRDVYGLVPLTTNRSVLDLFAAHVNNMSSPSNAKWRVAWFSLVGLPTVPVVHAGSDVPGYTSPTTSDGNVALGTIQDDPATSGTQYTILQCTSNNARFLANQVRPGDVVRTLYTNDGFGNYTYSEFLVAEVTSENQLRLQSGPAAPVNVPIKFEIWRNLNAQEEAEAIARTATWKSRRVMAVWPDFIDDAGSPSPGYFLAASLAGLASGVLPHQGLTRVALGGYTAVPRTTEKFNEAQLDIMAGAGIWIVTQNRETGQIYSRHALTTAEYSDINSREEMVTRNVDSISYRFYDQLQPFIGVTNVTPVVQSRLEVEIGSLLDVLRSELATNDLGGQIVDGTLVEVRPHAVLKDRYVVTINLSLPYPFNNVDVHLVV